MRGDARYRDRRRDADEDEEWRHQEAAADPEHAGDESDRQPHHEDEEYVDGEVGDRKVDLHGYRPPVGAPRLLRRIARPMVRPRRFCKNATSARYVGDRLIQRGWRLSRSLSSLTPPS